MYIPDFDTFYHLSEQLYKERPLETRYSLKYRHCDGTMVLKVTDDVKVRGVCVTYLPRVQRIHVWFVGGRVTAPRADSRDVCTPPAAVPARRLCSPQCLKFKTDQLSDMKRIERITNMFCAVMAGNEFREGEAVRRAGAAAGAAPAGWVARA